MNDATDKSPRILELRRGILKKNDEEAARLRRRFVDSSTYVVNLVSGPGTGKTRLLEETLRRMREQNIKVAALVGDPETDNDAQRLARSGAPVRQIRTRGVCHLEAEMVTTQLEGWDLNVIDYLFIENVGNLVCTTNFDLGESLRVVLLSVTEGEDKPLKYPGLFNSADVRVGNLECVVATVGSVEPDKPNTFRGWHRHHFARHRSCTRQTFRMPNRDWRYI
jgi:hydrogenase nickel incorporation protein HypB